MASQIVGGQPRRVSPGAFPVNTSQTLSALSFNGRWLALRDATPGARSAQTRDLGGNNFYLSAGRTF